MKRLWPLLFFALLPVLPLWRCFFLGEGIGLFNKIRQMAPWNGPAPTQPWDVLQADGVLQFYPWRDMVFKAWSHGQLPLWNNYELAGTPLLANSQSAGFYPPHVFMGVLHVPTPLAVLLLAWFHLFWAGLGTYLLARRFGASKIGAAVAGASFEISAFMLAWTGLPSVITTIAWIPWLLFAIKGVFELHPMRLKIVEECRQDLNPVQPDPARDELTAHARLILARSNVARKRYLRVTLLASLSAGMMLLAGHLQFAAYGFAATFVLATCLAGGSLLESLGHQHRIIMFKIEGDAQREVAHRIGRLPIRMQPWAGSSFRALLAVALGFALAAPQLLPVLSYSQFSHRKNTASAGGYAAYTAGAIKPFELANLTNAYNLGSPRTPVPLGEHTISAYWPALEKPGANLAESAVTIGPFVAGLLCLLPWKRKSLWPLALLAIVALLVALGTALNWPLYFLVPGWSSTGSPGRVIVLFVLSASVLAGIAIAGDRASDETGRVQRFVALLCPLVLTAICVLVGQTGASDKTAPMAAEAANQAMTPALLGALIGMAGIAVLIFPAAAKYRPGLVVVPVLLAWLGYAGNIIPTGQPIPVQDPKGFDRVAFINRDWSLLVAAPALAPPNTAYLLGEHELAGYDSLLHKDTKALLDSVDGQDAAPPANGNMVFVKPTANPGKLRDSGVSEVESIRPLPPLGDAAPEGGIYRYRINPTTTEYRMSDGGLALGRIEVGRVVSSGGPAEILSESFSQVVVKATGPGRLTLRDRNMPGWLAKIDGKHVPVQGTTWREVVLPPGEHTIEFNYVPPGLMIGLYIGVPAWLLLIGLTIAARPTRKSDTSAPKLT